MKETIYLYRIDDPETIKNIQFMAIRLNIRVKRITADMAGYKVGYITGLNGYTDMVSTEDFEVPHEQMMLMQNFTSSRIDQLLAFFRTAGIPRIPLKAMLTEHNKDWFFYELYEELKKERDAFHG